MEQELRAQIMEIRNDEGLTLKEKTKKIQALMTRGWTLSESKESVPEEFERTASFRNQSKGILGCKHYRRDFKVRAECCGRLYTCRICHDDVSDHKMDRHAVKEMMCMRCMQVQSVGATCTNISCKDSQPSKYYCDICHLFENSSRSIYHCEKCGICRVGKGLGIDFTHCDKCNMCIGVAVFDSHKCLERSLESNCPICREFMFTSRNSVHFLPCGHPMHTKCFQRYIRTNFTCPMCKTSAIDMKEHFQMIDQHVNSIVMPEEYRNHIAHILCNDCQTKSRTPFKFLYHKCQNCSSYNTSVLSVAADPPTC